MPERIQKLQPDRTISLRGFDSFAAAAAIHSASPTGFTVSGTFRDPADFAVVVLHDADNFYEHPSIKYLPDFDFSGLSLNFDLIYSDGLQPIDSPKYNWIDWATLDCVKADGSTARVRLWDYATLAAGEDFAAASTTLNLTSSGTVEAFDRATLWYENLAFDYIAPDGRSSVELQFFAHGTGTTHSITVNGRTYSHTETLTAGESSAMQASALVGLMAGDPDVVASIGSVAYSVVLSVRSDRSGMDIPVSASDGNAAVNMRLTTTAIAAANLAAQVNGADWVTANPPYSLMASVLGSQLTLTAGRFGTVDVSGTAVTWVSGTRFPGIPAGAPIFLAGVPYSVASVDSPTSLTLASSAGTLAGVRYSAPRGGRDGNLIQLYTTSKSSTLGFDLAQAQLSGGRSDVTWHCSVEFSAMIAEAPDHSFVRPDSLRQCWLTFAPSLVVGRYPATEWTAVFSNWALSGNESKKALKVAGPGSVRIEESDPACTFSPASSSTAETGWVVESGFYSQYFAKATRDMAATVTISYTCQSTHDLYIGTSLYSDRAKVGVSVDGASEYELECQLATSSAVVTRRRVAVGVAAGRHTVTIRMIRSGVFYFDFLEAAVVSDIPDALAPRTGISPALDFDTDHTYKLPPERVVWMLDRLGYAGPVNEYLGVFWWNERTRSGGSFSTGQVTFGGTFAGGETVFLTVNGTTLGKTVFPADSVSTIAYHFAAYLNSAFVGVWASASGGVLTMTGRSPSPDYNVTVSVSTTSSAGTVAVTTAPTAGIYPTWVIDATVSPPLNRAARDWHAGFFSLCAARGREVTTACSMELVNPPSGYAAEFPDTAHTQVATATGFGSLVSNHCATGSPSLLAYQKAVYREIARLQSVAGLVPSVQYGEFLWWYFAGPGGMGFYDDDTRAAAIAALGRELHVFTGPDDDPAVNGGADALFLRNRLRDHVSTLVGDVRSAYPTVRCEVLWPYDVNYPSPVGGLGGRLNRFINLPEEWQAKSSSGLDRMKVEALAFGAIQRDLDRAEEAIRLFPDFGWPLDSVRYLVPVFGSATPWNRELALAIGAGLTVNNLWAFDHICLYNLDVPEPGLQRRSIVKAA